MMTLNRTLIQACLLSAFLLILLCWISPYYAASPLSVSDPDRVPSLQASKETVSSSWMLKWYGEPDPAFFETSQVVSAHSAPDLFIVRPAPGVDEAEWLERWTRSDKVKYLTANQSLQLSAVKPSDPFLSRQKYLEQIHAEDAWVHTTQNDNVIIALIDTGVDLDHVDLKDNLVPGTNLIQRNQPPRDDNGHGTSVAGVMAALGNNNKGIAGLLWKAKIMPIKALEPNGRGDEDKLGEGIRYAVDHGAKIVVLSVGLLRNDPFLEEIVQYAEEKGVLLVAATGNDEGQHVRYPAAYPSVLAVGGIRTNNQVEYRSNYGPEVDLVAPWSVYTTAPSNKYHYNEGTSMAAPQVAAAAALAWSRNPGMKVYEIRNLLRQTAEDVGDPGWDMYSGYGLLRVDRALSQPYIPDIYEPNESRAAAKLFPLNTMLMGQLKDGRDADWFTIQAPYDGTLRFQLNSEQPIPADVKWVDYSSEYPEGHPISLGAGNTIEVYVRKGKNDFVLQHDDRKTNTAWSYRLTNTFHMENDPFEDNDRQFKAFRLAPRNQSVTGTFDHEGDQDWFSITVEKSGTLTFNLTADTKRMDLILKVQKKGEKLTTVDQNGDGEPESYRLDAFPGTYYILVDKTTQHAVNGTYTLDVQYEVRLLDPNEPNDKSYQGTLLGSEYELEGIIEAGVHHDDVDWFKLTVTEESLLQLHVHDVPANRVMRMDLHNTSLDVAGGAENQLGQTQVDLVQRVAPGTYYVKVTANAGFVEQMYRISAQMDRIVGGYIDVADHWAQSSIVGLSNRHIIEGFGDYTFRPQRPVSRAEAVTMLARAFGYSKRKAVHFDDLPDGHWAYNSISLGAQAGLIQGYPDGTIRPDRALSRVEMAVMVANAMGISGKQRGNVPFSDIASDYWATPILKQMKMEGWISGYEDNTFHPDAPCTRAEFAALLTQVLG